MRTVFYIILVATTALNGQQVYNFTLENTEKEQVSFNELKGEKLTIVDFWATWCKPCQASIPKINKLHDEFKDKGVSVIGINIDSPRNQAKVKPFSNAMGIKYPILLDTEQEVMSDFNVNSIPILFFVNNKNEIVYTHVGYSAGDEQDLRNKINKYLTD